MADHGMTPAQLKSARKALGLSEAEFARAVGVASDHTVSKWEDGERDIPGPVAILCSLAANISAVAHATRGRISN